MLDYGEVSLRGRLHSLAAIDANNYNLKLDFIIFGFNRLGPLRQLNEYLVQKFGGDRVNC